MTAGIEYYREGNCDGWRITEYGKLWVDGYLGLLQTTTKYTGGTPAFDYDTIKHLFE